MNQVLSFILFIVFSINILILVIGCCFFLTVGVLNTIRTIFVSKIEQKNMHKRLWCGSDYAKYQRINLRFEKIIYVAEKLWISIGVISFVFLLILLVILLFKIKN